MEAAKGNGRKPRVIRRAVTISERAEIRQCRTEGVSLPKLSEEFNRPLSSIQTITRDIKGVSAPAGRPRTGEVRQCERCGKEIYVRNYRIKKGLGHYCRACAKKEQRSSFRFAIKGLIISCGNKYSVQEMFDHAIGILLRHLEKSPERTLKTLVNIDKPFTIDEILHATCELCIEESLRRSDEFVEIDKGVWDLIGGDKCAGVWSNYKGR